MGTFEIRDSYFGVVVATAHGLDVAQDVPTFGRNVDQESGVARLRDLRIFFRARDQDRELGTGGAGNEPLVTVDQPVIVLLDGLGLDQRRIGSRNIGLGHGETRARDALAQRPQVLLLLLRRRPMQQSVHVAFVRSLGVEGEGTEARLSGFGGDAGHGHVTQPHASELLRHVGQPKAPLLGGLAHVDDLFDQDLSRVRVPGDLLLGGADDVVHELPGVIDSQLDIFREGEVDGHGFSSWQGTRVERSRSGSCDARDWY